MPGTIIFTHNSFGGHEVPPGHVEHPGRYQAVQNALTAEEFQDAERRTARQASAEAIERVHPSIYREAVAAAAPQTGLAQLDADTFMGPSSLTAALCAAGAAIEGIDALYAGDAKNAFVAARPPGHHAEPKRAMGFCMFNSAAVAAHHARAVHGAKRIAVVDFDVHHGNGTEAAFWEDEDAFFASSHEWPQYPGTGRETDRGAFNNIANAPLATGTDGDAFQRAWGDRLLPVLSDFEPDIIVISAGFDAHAADRLGGLSLTEEDYAWVTNEILRVADDKCEGRIVSLMEGGYDLDALASSAATHVRALMAA